MMETVTATLTLKPGRDKPVRNRHPWIFSGAIKKVDGNPAPGDLVAIQDHHGRPLARAYYNPHSQIRARILTWDETPINPDFWQTRLQRAADGRDALNLHPHTTAYRLVNAEADGLPGLIVDRYQDHLVIQCLTLGIDRRKEMLIDLLRRQFQPAGILERSDVAVRKKEGLSPVTKLHHGRPPASDFTILEHDLKFGVNLQQGHKTGFYLDQRVNRAAVCQPRLVAGQSILNVFAYTGGFAVYAAAHDAGPITNLDSSADVLAQAEQNIARNGRQRPSDEYIVGDAFTILRHYRDNGRHFNVVILDPPKFVHSRRDIKRAARGYKDLNWLAMRLLTPGGILATFSCSGLVSADLFQKIVFGAAVDAGRDAQILYTMGQAPDHPILLSFPESAYLKGLLCRVW